MRKYLCLSAVVILSGCQLANEAKGIQERGGTGAFSCQQIEAAFRAYDADRQSVDAYIELARITGLSTTDVTTESADSYYAKARERANIALLLQGCQPL